MTTPSTSSSSTSVTSSERVQRGVHRVLSKLDASIEAGNYYEAHQMYRTLYFRYVGQQKFVECLDLLYDGAMKLLEKRQFASTADLGLLLIDTLEKRNTKTDVDLWIDRLIQIIIRLDVNTVERETLVTRAIKWSTDANGNDFGHPKLHRELAQMYWDEANYEQARHHFLLCKDGNLCALKLITISNTQGFPNEIDLFIVQAVLQQLCMKEFTIAKDTFYTFISKHPKIRLNAPPFESGLLNFTYYLLRCIDETHTEGFRTLKNLYKPYIQRDPAYEKYLIKIGMIYFDEVPPNTRAGGGLMGGMFGEMLSYFFQGPNDDDDDDDDDGGDGGNVNNSSVQRRQRNITQVNELD